MFIYLKIHPYAIIAKPKITLNLIFINNHKNNWFNTDKNRLAIQQIFSEKLNLYIYKTKIYLI